MISLLTEAATLSIYFGIRPDLVQAGGGNVSVKNENILAIKASGYSLAQINNQQGFVLLDNNKLLTLLNDPFFEATQDKRLREHFANKKTNEALVVTSQDRPSIETLFHALLNTYTLHLHPIVVNALACLEHWEAIFKDLFPESLCIPYETPGVELALTIKRLLSHLPEKPSIIFLQNHGLIISAQTAARVKELTETVIKKLEQYLSVDHQHYHAISKLADLWLHVFNIVPVIRLIQNAAALDVLKNMPHLLFSLPTCPDTTVYCGYRWVTITDTSLLLQYQKTYGKPPVIVLYQEHLFIVTTTLKKAAEIEDVFVAHLLSLAITVPHAKINTLSEQECLYLHHWEAEQYRQKL